MPTATAAYSDQGMFLFYPVSAGLNNHVHQWFITGLGVALQASKSGECKWSPEIKTPQRSFGVGLVLFLIGGSVKI